MSFRAALLRGFAAAPAEEVVTLPVLRRLYSGLKRVLFTLRHTGADLDKQRDVVIELLDQAQAVVGAAMPLGAGLPPAKLRDLWLAVGAIREEEETYLEEERPQDEVIHDNLTNRVRVLSAVEALLLESVRATRENP